MPQMSRPLAFNARKKKSLRDLYCDHSLPITAWVLLGALMTSIPAGAAQPVDFTLPAGERTGSVERVASQAGDVFGHLPLSFEANLGQADSRVQFLSRGNGYSLFLTSREAVWVFKGPASRMATGASPVPRAQPMPINASGAGKAPAVLRMRVVGGGAMARAEGLGRQAGTVNYFGGRDPAGWRYSVETFGAVRYRNIYPGIDLVYQGDARELEYDFVIAPGADPGAITLGFEGAEAVALDGKGDLTMQVAGTEIRQTRPFVYQQGTQGVEEVGGAYVLKGDDRIGFRVGNYDPGRPLVIDPVLKYATYLGGMGYDAGLAIAVDGGGRAYITGVAFTADFPVTPGAFQTGYGGDDAFVTKLNAAGTALVYSTYITGARPEAIAVDAAGNAYLAGTAGAGFPATPGAFQTEFAGGFDAFVTKLDPTGSRLVYSTLLGGNFNEFGRGIALDAAGNAYVAGTVFCAAPQCTFPTVNAFQSSFRGGNNDAFVSKLNASGSALVYSTFLGGGAVLNNTDDWGEGIAVDSAGSAYVTGHTFSPDFPTTAGAFDRTAAGLDGFVTKFSPGGSTLVYSTRLGGSGHDEAHAIAVDAGGYAYVTGTTDGEFPTTSGAFQTAGTFDAFITKLNPAGSALVYSTYLGGLANATGQGGNGVDRGWGIAVDGAGRAFVTGDTQSPNFPTLNAVQPLQGSAPDAFVTELNAAGTALIYSTYLGGRLTDEGRGIAIDANGGTYATGNTSSFDFPTTAAAFQPGNAGGLESSEEAFVVKITASASPALTISALGLNPARVKGGQPSTGTVSLSGQAPAGGAVVALSSSHTGVATVPGSATVAAGATSASFTVTTKPQAQVASATISASYNSTSRTAAITVDPPGDTVTVQRAEYHAAKRKLRVEAKSTSSSATLKVYVTATGQLIGTLANKGNGSYGAQLAWSWKPERITVRSSLGGSATRIVTLK